MTPWCLAAGLARRVSTHAPRAGRLNNPMTTPVCRNIMAIEVVVPRLGWSMDEGTFGEWLKQDGEFVKRGEGLFVLEGEKSAQDIESFDERILRIPPDAPQPGDTVTVGQVLAFLVAKGEAVPFEMVT